MTDQSVSVSVTEGKAVLDGLMGHAKARIAHVILNGQKLPQTALRRRVSYVRADSVLAPSLSVSQTLAYYSILRKPPHLSASKFSVMEQVVRFNI